MTKLHKKIATAVSAAAILMQATLPVFAQTTTLTITGNGASSDNDVVVTQVTTTQVVQNNVANISNDVDADADTGNNDANMNTGGSVLIGTGDAKTTVGISNEANSNVADINGCCAVNASVEISENGYDSDNDAVLTTVSDTQVYQKNYAYIKNDVDADSDTGKNDANMNTGGDVSILTGSATTKVLIANKANSNLAQIGSGAGGNGSVSLKILGNGAKTDNDIILTLQRSLLLTQDNLADIRNKVDADSDTGHNDANMNTGGDVLIGTGNAKTIVGIDNMANFNSADLNCGCLLDVVAKIAGNGYDTDNTIVATLLDTKAVFQSNAYVCGGYGYPWVGQYESWFPWYDGYKKNCNDVDADSDTGHNDAEKNTGPVEIDPVMIGTGDATTEVAVSTTANANVLTEGTGFDFPQIPELEWDFDFGFNWAFLWAWLVGMGS